MNWRGCEGGRTHAGAAVKQLGTAASMNNVHLGRGGCEGRGGRAVKGEGGDLDTGENSFQYFGATT